MNNPHIDIEWNGIFNPNEENAVREQLTASLRAGHPRTCECGNIIVAVFGDWVHNTFDGFLYCRCGRQLYSHLNGRLTLPVPDRRRVA